MSSKDNNYSASDIERYHAGTMTASERHALEKAALEDPFLADALEGYTYSATAQLDLEKIKARLIEKQSSKRRPFLLINNNWLKAAAIFVFIAGIAWILYLATTPEKQNLALEPQVEKTKKAEQSTPATKQDTIPVTPSIPPAVPGEGTTIATREKTDLNNTIAPEVKDQYKEKPDQVVKTEESQKENNDLALSKSYYNKPATEITNTERNASAPTSNSPVPGFNNSNTRIQRTENNIVNDRNDTSRDDLARQQARVRGVVPVDTVSNLNVVLQPTNEGLSEVVVLGYGKRDSAYSKFSHIKIDTLEPTIGWRKFDEYIANNIQAPDDIKTKQLPSREVELSFDINKNGEPVNIVVTRSLCEKCDEEAIRLLKDGPKWKKKKTRKGKITIKF